MRLNLIAFVAGAWLLQQQQSLPDAFGFLVLAAASLALGAFSLWHPPRWRGAARAAAMLAFLAAGFLWAGLRADWRLDDALPYAWEGRDVELVGVVASPPRVDERGVRFAFDVERVLTEDASVPRRASLAWRREGDESGARLAEPVRAGERWQLTVRLKRPHGSANPHGFDYEAWALERNIRADGYVRTGGDIRRLDNLVHRPAYLVQRARQAVRERLQRVLAGAPYAGVIVALAVGDQNSIPASQWQVFTRTGVNHLMSISGLHVTIVSGFAYVLAFGLWRRVPRWTLALPAAKAATVAGAVAALAYALLAGFAVPTQRTLYMLSVVALALWLGRLTSATRVLAAALLVVVALDPWAVLSAGFWLSFGAVAVILMVSVGRVGTGHWLVQWGRVQGAVTLGLMPPLIALFQQVSIASPLANAAAIPVVSLVVVPLTLAGALLPLDWPLLLAHQVMAWCMVFLQWLSALPSAVWRSHAPPAWAIVAAVAGVAWLLMPRGMPARWVGVIGVMPLFLLPVPRPAQGELWVDVLDVGQGMAVVARTENHALLYDTGPSFGPESDSGSRIVVPYLRGEGIKRLDTLVVSHDDNDHSGGALSVLQAVPVGKVVSSLPAEHAIAGAAAQHESCEAGRSWEWDGVRFQFLHPLPEHYADGRRSANALSCVLLIRSGHGSALLPGDIGQREERELLARADSAFPVTLLVAAHHGSRSSSSEPFVAAAQPEAVVFTAGYRNPFGHPRQEVVQRFASAGSRIYRSDRDGAVLVKLKAGAVEAARYRELRRRYWSDAGQ